MAHTWQCARCHFAIAEPRNKEASKINTWSMSICVNVHSKLPGHTKTINSIVKEKFGI